MAFLNSLYHFKTFIVIGLRKPTMKLPNKIFKIGFILILFSLIISAKNYTSNPIKKEIFVSIEKLIKENKLEAKINGIGGHTEECVAFDLKNLTADTLYIHLEAGRRLTSIESETQDIFVVKNKAIRLEPHQEKTIIGYGFCCQSSNSSPSIKSEFNIGLMTPPEWLKLAEVIDENNFPSEAIQSAVWVLSNNHKLSSVHHEDLEKIQLLRQTLADIKGIILPWYTLTYQKDTAQLFTDKPDKLISDISYYLKTNSSVHINIRNAQGNLVYTVAKRINPGRGQHSFHLRLPVNNWPKGEYALYIYEDDNNLNTKKIFEL